MSSSAAIVAPTSFDYLRLGRYSQFIVARLLRFWDSRNIKKQGEFMGITLLFLDEQKRKYRRMILRLNSPADIDDKAITTEKSEDVVVAFAEAAKVFSHLIKRQ
ncbi:hypothetical protein Rs2_28099 [Raphanus sativus]|nr:hypothetical protein Rs2_28099 [Raphanus sativus]